MTSFKNENAVVKAISDAIKKSYPKAYILKIHGGMYQEAGIPDLLVTVDGLTVGIEVKHQKPGETREHALDRTTQRQRVHIHRIIEAGGMAGVAPDAEAGLYLIQLAKLKQRKMMAGAPIDSLPLPPDWDFLMRADADPILTEIQIDPTPIKNKD